MSHRYPPPSHQRDRRPADSAEAGVARPPAPRPTHRQVERRPLDGQPVAAEHSTALLDHPTRTVPALLDHPTRPVPDLLDHPTRPVPALLDHPTGEAHTFAADEHLDDRFNRYFDDPTGVDPDARAWAASDAPSPHLDAGPYPGQVEAQPGGWTRRLVRGSLLVGVALVTAAVALFLPSELEGDSDGSSRVEAADGSPDGSNALLTSDTELTISGTLADAGHLTRQSGGADTAGEAAGLIALATGPVGADGLVLDAEGTATSTTMAPTTTAWVEPAIPPESEWIDAGNGVRLPDVLLRIRFCESTNNYAAANSHSSARGAYQFLTGSWEWYGHAERTGAARAHLATPAQQDESALLTLQADGTTPWAASRACWANPEIDPRYATAKPPVTPAPTTTTTTEESTTTTTEESTTTTTEESTTTTTEESTTTTTEAESTTTSTD